MRSDNDVTIKYQSVNWHPLWYAFRTLDWVRVRREMAEVELVFGVKKHRSLVAKGTASGTLYGVPCWL